MRGAHDGANHPAPDAQQESADGIARDLEGGIAALVRGLGTPHRAGRDHALELGFPCGVEDSAAQRHEDFCCEKEVKLSESAHATAAKTAARTAPIAEPITMSLIREWRSASTPPASIDVTWTPIPTPPMMPAGSLVTIRVSSGMAKLMSVPASPLLVSEINHVT